MEVVMHGDNWWVFRTPAGWDVSGVNRQRAHCCTGKTATTALPSTTHLSSFGAARASAARQATARQTSRQASLCRRRHRIS